MNNSSLSGSTIRCPTPPTGCIQPAQSVGAPPPQRYGLSFDDLAGDAFSDPLLLVGQFITQNDTDIFIFPPVWIPTHALWSNYPEALSYMNFERLLRNTLVIALLNTVGTLFSSAFVAYGFSRFRFKGRDLLFGLLLGTMMLPFQVTMIPLFRSSSASAGSTPTIPWWYRPSLPIPFLSSCCASSF